MTFSVFSVEGVTKNQEGAEVGQRRGQDLVAGTFLILSKLCILNTDLWLKKLLNIP